MFSDNERNGAIGGYMTTEAVFIIPWIFFIIVLLIYLGYFQYDRTLLFQDNYTLATQTAARIASSEEKQNWLDGQISNGISHKYMGLTGFSMSGSVSSDEIKMSSEIKVRQPFPSGTDIIPIGDWKITDNVNADNYSFTKRIRLYRAVGRVID